MKSFREEIIADYTRKLREADDKYTYVVYTFDQEKKRSAHLYDQLQIALDKIQVLL